MGYFANMKLLWMAQIMGLAALFFVSTPLAAQPSDVKPEVPAHIATFDDGRASLQELYASYGQLLEHGWNLDIIHNSQPPGTSDALPIIALRSPREGPAIWLISGIHGEEPAGPWLHGHYFHR